MLAFLVPLAAASRTGVGAVGVLGRAAPDSAVPLLLAVTLLGCVVWTADRMSSMATVVELAAPHPASARGPDTSAGPAVTAGLVAVRRAPLSPRLSAGCEIATGVTMGFMLIMMLT